MEPMEVSFARLIDLDLKVLRLERQARQAQDEVLSLAQQMSCSRRELALENRELREEIRNLRARLARQDRHVA